ncbi:MAG: response regulator [Sandaracinus sp.]
MSASRTILLVEDDTAHVELARRAIERSEGLGIRVVGSIASARAALAEGGVDLVLADLRLPDGSGLDLLDQSTPVVVQTSQGDEARAVAAMKGGALDYCVKSPEMYRDLPVTIERALNAATNLVERRKAEHGLRESDERFRQLVANIPEVFWLFDLATREVVYASPAWRAVYGDGPQSWEGRLAHVHADDLGALWVLGASDGDVFRIVDGASTRWVEERRFWIAGADGNPYRLACLGLDVTRRRELEASLRHAQKMNAIGELAGGVAHDFNNMLAPILSGAQELAASGGDAELCNLIVSAATRARQLTRNLLAFSRRGRAGVAVVNVHAVVSEAVALLRRTVPAGVRVTKSLTATNTELVGDAGQLQSALLNLGINARDALPGGGTIRFVTRDLELEAIPDEYRAFELAPGRYVELRVEDDGIGMPPEVLVRVFEPFFTTKDVGHGTGLGLAAVYATVLELRGAVTVTSREREGSVFTLLLPARPGEQIVPTSSPAVPVGGGLVLLIEDEALVLRGAQRMLERLGYRVVSAVDGEAGWAAFERHRDELVAVVSDLTMPRLDGRTLLRRIRGVAPGLPCVLCTGFAGEGEQDLPVLLKPYSREELAATLEAAIRRGGTA